MKFAGACDLAALDLGFRGFHVRVQPGTVSSRTLLAPQPSAVIVISIWPGPRPRKKEKGTGRISALPVS